MKNVLLISLNSGGTMGHGRIITSLANHLIKSKNKVTIVSEVDYSHFFSLSKNVRKIFVPSTKHVNYTIGGMYNYKHKSRIINILEKEKIDCIIFSTFFDPNLVKEIKKRKIKVILLSYPLRDTFRKALINNKAYDLFDKVISLYDLSTNRRRLKNEILTNPLKIIKSNQKRNPKFDILITCGGGGRPSSTIFMNKVLNALDPILERENLRIISICGKSNNKKRVKGIRFIKWSKRFEDIIASSKLIISEAGYFTILDLINNRKSAIFIPGIRIIDNQELRALTLERFRIGKVYFSFEKEQKLTKLIREFLDKDVNNTAKFAEIKKRF